MKIVGHIRTEIVRGDGTVEVDEFYNIVTTYGKESVAEYLLATPARGKPSYIGVGNTGDASQPALGEVALKAPYGARLALNPIASRAGAVITASTTFPAGFFSGQNITEYGLFIGLADSTMLCRQVATAKNLTSSDALTVAWTLSLG